MDEDMGIMFNAVDKNYKMPMQYKYTWNTLQNFGQFRDKRIWKNFTYFIDWMERNFPKEKFFEIMGKSYDLEDSILYRILNTQTGKDPEKEKKDQKTVETWLMSNIFRHVENPNREQNPDQKYIGYVKFEKVTEGKFEGEYARWNPSQSKDKINDIRITVYTSDGFITKPREYEKEHGWKKEWEDDGINKLTREPDKKDEKRHNQYVDWKNWKKNWNDSKAKGKLPGWYYFNAENPAHRDPNHNLGEFSN